jgi:secretion system chaperone SscA
MTDKILTLDQLHDRIANHLKEIGAYQSLIKESEDGQFVTEELYCCAYHFYENGKYAEAVDFFKILTQMDSESVSYWVGLGASQQMLKNYNEALLAYSTALILNQKDPIVYLYAANCCFALKHIAEGLKALDVAESIAADKPEHEALLSEVAILKEVWSNVDKTDNLAGTVLPKAAPAESQLILFKKD